ncbi:GMC family oxidoreductase [Corallococcus sp. BB11-1]|uniref:GMC family oxidoreductase N-terminal domain-containing protein n=1 Tax=Corallococcus sp. BB11-1 TaxID=2996783 RepID=UPI00227192F6|nr:GMC family oxidoreductase [Corallococcus sp. BB11-1]MCY1032163.1 GMC family oxidoreductase [Corallococcus sp. BB11-1]
MRLCIIGSGVVGVVIARAALHLGHEVVMLEAGPRVPMRNWRRWLDFVTTGVRPYHACEDAQGDANQLAGADPAFDHFLLKGSRLMAVGGSTLHWSGWTPRLQPEDFELHSRTGKGLDWPFGYRELEPYYGQAEQLLNVTGPQITARGHPTPWRSTSYKWNSPPYPVETEPGRRALTELGITYDHVPMSRRGESNEGVGGPCMTFGTCRYCPMGARFDPTLLLPTLEAHPGFRLLSESPALALQMQAGKASGVVHKTPGGGTATVTADAFVVASGALESPKLLWRSGFDARKLPALGRYLTTHPMLKLDGRLAGPPRAGFTGREVPMPAFFSRHFDTPEHQAAGKMLFSEYPEELDLQAWAAKGLQPEYLASFAREPRFNLHGFIEEFPHPDNRILPGDDGGGRAVSVSYAAREGFRERWQWMTDTLMEVMKRTGCREQDVVVSGVIRRADHSVGTVRFGPNPETGVVDGRHLLHGTRNVFAVTNGNFPNNGAINPTLTLTALTLRFADQVLPTLTP